MTAKHKLYPEPGTWVIDDRSGLPRIEPPEDLPPGKLNSPNIKDQISYHGLGFCLYSYISPENVADIHLRKLWQKARRDMREIVSYLENADKQSRDNVILKKRVKTNSVIGEKLL